MFQSKAQAFLIFVELTLIIKVLHTTHHSLCKGTKKHRENAYFCVLFRIEKYRKVLKYRKVFFRILTSLFFVPLQCESVKGQKTKVKGQKIESS